VEDIRISLDTAGAKNELNVVRIDGVIDTMTATELERVMNSLLEQKKYNIVVDLAGVDYISSAGWGIFISNIREIRSHKGDIKLARMIPSVYEIFELLEFDTILQSFDSIEKAKTNFRAPAGSEHPASSTAAKEAPAAVAVVETRTEIKTEEYHPSVASETSAEILASTEIDTIAKPISVEQEILSLVKADPFYTIREMTKLVNSSGNGSEKPVGWWKIWRILRRNSLLSKRNRYRFSRR